MDPVMLFCAVDIVLR